VNVIVITPPSGLSVALHSQFSARGRASINVAVDDLSGLSDDLLIGALVVDADALCFLQRNSAYSDDEFQDLLSLRQAFWDRCRQFNVPTILLSDGRVFGVGNRVNSESHEADVPAPACLAGEQLATLERAMLAHIEQIMVLRTGPLIAVQAGSFLSDCLATMRGGEVLRLNDTRISYPTPVADLARVVSGLVDQISCGAPCSGIYHYCSSGAASAYEFAEVACAFASQFVAPMAGLEVDEDSLAWCPDAPAISCERILQDFGIKRLPWRAYLPRMIKTVCEETTK
jgi:dTDP-4-dehydrorhamnose reductase